MPTTSQAEIEALEFQDALWAFRQSYPAFAATSLLDELRDHGYARLGAQNQVYLNYTGAGLYAESQLRAHMELLSQNVYKNPHSKNPRILSECRSWGLEISR